MDKIASFQINHLLLNPGIYVSRKDKAGDQILTTFDIRMTKPNYEPVMELTYKYGCDPVFICESAGTQAEDARQMKDYYNSIRGEKQ